MKIEDFFAASKVELNESSSQLETGEQPCMMLNEIWCESEMQSKLLLH